MSSRGSHSAMSGLLAGLTNNFRLNQAATPNAPLLGRAGRVAVEVLAADVAFEDGARRAVRVLDMGVRVAAAAILFVVQDSESLPRV